MWRYKDFPYHPCHPTCITFSIINITHQNDTFLTKDEPILGHIHPKLEVYILRVLTNIWWDIAIIITALGIFFTALRGLCVLPIHLYLPPLSASGNHWSVYYLHSFVFSRMSESWNNRCSLFRLAFSLNNMHLSFHHNFSWLDSSTLISSE